ncbi:MAG TPA: hypothetical protein P5280_18390 [Cyclobacteriaceae bacterium]|nr:hypothetical protein [Cyclobacteriaceae bacterium]
MWIFRGLPYLYLSKTEPSRLKTDCYGMFFNSVSSLVDAGGCNAEQLRIDAATSITDSYR